MGWASGSTVANEVWAAVAPNLIPGTERKVAKAIVAALEGMDWDTQDEAPELMRACRAPRKPQAATRSEGEGE